MELKRSEWLVRCILVCGMWKSMANKWKSNEPSAIPLSCIYQPQPTAHLNSKGSNEYKSSLTFHILVCQRKRWKSTCWAVHC